MRPFRAVTSAPGATWPGRLALALLYPATVGLPPRRWAMARHRAEIVAACRGGRAQRVSFIGATAGAHLDGLWLLPPAAELTGLARLQPCLVVVVGNAMTYELIAPQALSLAASFGLGVLLYNSRGLGRSLGQVTCPQDAVDDCRAAIRWAQRLGGPVGLYGISLGAAWALRAAQQMAAAGELSAAGLGLIALVRTFASPRQVVAAHLGPAAGRLAERCLAAAGFDNLDLAAALARPLPARQVMLTAASRDALVPPAAQLATALELSPNTHAELPSGQTALVVADHGASHFDRQLQAPLHDAALRQFAATAPPPGPVALA